MPKNSRNLVFLAISVFIGNIIHAQKGGPFPNELKSIFEQEIVSPVQKNDIEFLKNWREHLIVHLDRNNLDKGDPIFFKVYILTGPNRVRATLSKVLRLEIINERQHLVKTQYHRIQDGMTQGTISFPKNLDAGVYTLRIYTQWMKNYGEDNYFKTNFTYHSKGEKVTVKNGDSELGSLNFYPEGGKLVENLDNWLLIKASDKTGKEIDIQGDILDEDGFLIKSVKPYGKGISSVRFTPEKGKEYVFRTKDGRSFPFPKIEEKGFLINANTLNQQILTLRVQVSEEFVGSKVWLQGSMDNMLYFKKELNIKDSNTVVEIPKEGIPYGILKVELKGLENNVLAERPVVMESSKLNISSEVLQEGDGKENVYLIKVTDAQGKPLETNLSISVTQLAKTAYGHSKNLNNDGSQAKIDLNDNMEGLRTMLFKKDLDLMTSTGKRESARGTDFPETIKYPFQRGLNLYGYAYDLNNELLSNTEIQIYGVSDDNVFAKEITTDAYGMLRLEDLQFEGETDLVFRTSGDDTQSRLVKFIPREETAEGMDETSAKNRAGEYQKKPGELVQSTFWEPIDKDRLVILDEVSVTDNKQQKRKTSPSIYGVEPNRVVFQDFERPQTIPQLFLGIPGVKVGGMGTFEPWVSLPKVAGLGPVLWVLDGMPLMQPTALSDIMSMVSYTDVDKIEILFAAQAAIFGSRASGGAIVIYTRSGGFLDNISRKEAMVKFQGYSDGPNFENYMENRNRKSGKAANEVTTLYWNPSLKTNEKGEAMVTFKRLNKDSSVLELRATAVTEGGETGQLQVIY